MKDSKLSSHWPKLEWVFWITVVVGGMVLVFWNDLLIILNEGLVSEGYSYVVLLPPVVAYLIYRKKAVLGAIQSLPARRRFGDLWTVVGLSMLLGTFVVYFYASSTTYALEWRLFMLPFFASGVVLTLFGYRFWRVIAIPIVFLVFFEPYFIELTNPYWSLLANISAIGSHSLMNLVGFQTQLSASLTGPVITSVGRNGAQYAFDIGVGSSGLQSLVGYTLFAVLVAYLFSGSLVKRIVLFALGYPLLVILNILRVIGVVGLTNFVGQTAGSIFHLTGGLFLIFVGTIVLLIFGQKFLRLSMWPIYTPVASCDHSLKGMRYCLKCGKAVRRIGPGLTRRRSVGFAAVAVMVALLFSIQTPAYAQSTTLNKTPLSSTDPSVLMNLLPQIPGWNLTFGYRDTAVEAALQQDASLVFYYQRNDTQGQLQSITAIVQIGPLYHTWEASLVTHLQKVGLPSATVLADENVHIVGSVTVPANYFVFIRPGSTLVEAVLQWITRAPFLIGGTYEDRFVMMTIYSNVPVMYNTGLITNSSDLQQVLNIFTPFGQRIVNYWAPSNTATYIHLNFPMSYALVGLVAVPDALAVAGYTVRTSGKKRSVRGIVKRVASNQDLDLLQSVMAANRSGKGLLTDIQNELQKRGEPISPERLSEELDRATDLGLLQARIVELSEVPYYTWKLEAETMDYLVHPTSSGAETISPKKEDKPW
jgi:exosortase